MNRKSFFYGFSSLISFSQVTEKADGKYLKLTQENTLTFFTLLTAFSDHFGACVLAESFPYYWESPLLENFVNKDFSEADLLKLICEAYDYELVNSHSCYLLEKKYSYMIDVPGVSLHELGKLMKDIASIVSSTAPGDFFQVGNISGWSNPVVKYLCERVDKSRLGKNLPIQQYENVVQKNVGDYFWVDWVGYVETRARGINRITDSFDDFRLDINQNSINGRMVGKKTVGLWIKMRSGLFAGKPEHFRPSMQGADSGDRYEKDPLKAPPVVDNILELAKRMESSSLAIKVGEFINEKQISIFGNAFAKSDSILNGVAKLFNLKLTKDRNAYILDIKSVESSNIDMLWRTIVSVLPPGYLRILIDEAKSGTAQFDPKNKIRGISLECMKSLRWRVEKNLQDKKADRNKVVNLEYADTCRLAFLEVASFLQELKRAAQPAPVVLTQLNKSYVCFEVSETACTMTVTYPDPATGSPQTVRATSVKLPT